MFDQPLESAVNEVWGDDDEWSLDLSMEDSLVGFGKFANLSYEELLEEDPRYCQWILHESTRDDPSPAMRDLRKWLGQQEVGPRTMSFGKYKGLTFEEVLREDPDYAKWVVGKVEKSSDPSDNLRAFARWVGEQSQALDDEPQAVDVDGGTLRCGKHKGSSFKAVLDQDPSYCDWVLRRKHSGKGLGPFAAWLRETLGKDRV